MKPAMGWQRQCRGTRRSASAAGSHRGIDRDSLTRPPIGTPHARPARVRRLAQCVMRARENAGKR